MLYTQIKLAQNFYTKSERNLDQYIIKRKLLIQSFFFLEKVTEKSDKENLNFEICSDGVFSC